MSTLIIALIAIAAVILLWLVISAMFRVVAPTNEVHIVQRSKSTTPYGKGEGASTYYAWPSWLPMIGVETIVLPVSIFDVDLDSYLAYDNGKVPFVVDIKAWYRVHSPSVAAERIETIEHLKSQLDDIMRGAVRKTLAAFDIENIMETRQGLGDKFIAEVSAQVEEFGVDTLKIEFMDIRDPNDGSSKVVNDIMEKKKSLIEKESRVEVAENNKEARIKEISAAQEAAVKQEEANEIIGKRTAQKTQEIGVANEIAQQKIKEQAAKTKEREMAVLKVQEVSTAEIIKETEIVKADQDATTVIIRAEAHRDQQEIIAQGNMEAEKKRAEGVEAVGLAQAEAEKAMQLAPVRAQIELAEEIGENSGYMEYLLSVEQINANREVGIEKAKALQNSDTKIIATSNNADSGLNSVMDLFTAKGGISIAEGLETLKQTPAGAAMYEKFIGSKKKEIKGTDAEVVVDVESTE